VTVAPPPPEYAEATVERALWQNFGRRIDELTTEEYEIKTAILRHEAAQEERKRSQSH
jgi:hypothetical protein